MVNDRGSFHRSELPEVTTIDHIDASPTSLARCGPHGPRMLLACRTSRILFEMGEERSTSSANLIDKDPPKVLVAQIESIDVWLLAFLTCILALSIVAIIRNVAVGMQREAFDESSHCVLRGQENELALMLEITYLFKERPDPFQCL